MYRQVTEEGWRALGELLKQSREDMKWSMEELVRRIKEANPDGPRNVSPSTISGLERGHGEPKITTLASLANTGYIKHPVSGRLMSAIDLIDYAFDHSNKTVAA